MLAAVASFAVESGLVETGVGEAKDKWIRVLSDNTGTVFVLGVRVDTTGEIVYEGSAEVAGVPGTGSPTVVKSLTPQGCDSCYSKHLAFCFALLFFFNLVNLIARKDDGRDAPDGKCHRYH